MSDLYKYINIKNLNIVDEIEKCIKEVKEELSRLDEDRMCKIYTSYLYLKLKEKGVLNKIIDTEDDLNLNYKHRFIVVPKDSNNNYIIDLTYSQFIYNPLFEEIYSNGYKLLNKDEYKEYINNIIKSTNKKEERYL